MINYINERSTVGVVGVMRRKDKQANECTSLFSVVTIVMLICFFDPCFSAGCHYVVEVSNISFLSPDKVPATSTPAKPAKRSSDNLYGDSDSDKEIPKTPSGKGKQPAHKVRERLFSEEPHVPPSSSASPSTESSAPSSAFTTPSRRGPSVSSVFGNPALSPPTTLPFTSQLQPSMNPFSFVSPSAGLSAQAPHDPSTANSFFSMGFPQMMQVMQAVMSQNAAMGVANPVLPPTATAPPAPPTATTTPLPSASLGHESGEDVTPVLRITRRSSKAVAGSPTKNPKKPGNQPPRKKPKSSKVIDVANESPPPYTQNLLAGESGLDINMYPPVASTSTTPFVPIGTNSSETPGFSHSPMTVVDDDDGLYVDVGEETIVGSESTLRSDSSSNREPSG